jgi:hypothetical protein
VRSCPCRCGRVIGRERVAQDAVDLAVTYPILEYAIGTRDAQTAVVLRDVLADARAMTESMLAYAHGETSEPPKPRVKRFVRAVVCHAVFDIAQHDPAFIAYYVERIPENQQCVVLQLTAKQARIPHPPRRDRSVTR